MMFHKSKGIRADIWNNVNACEVEINSLSVFFVSNILATIKLKRFKF